MNDYIWLFGVDNVYHVYSEPRLIVFIYKQFPGAPLTKPYDVTIQRYPNSQGNIEDSKMHVLRCMSSKFCVKFQRCPLKFHTEILTHTPQNMHFTKS